MNSSRKYSYLFWGFILLLLVLGGGNYFGLIKKNVLKDAVIVKVTDHKLFAQDFSQKLAWALKEYDVLLSKDPKIIEFVKNKITEDFIRLSLMKDWAKQNNISVSDEDINNELLNIRKNYSDDISFQQVLSESGQTLEEYKASLGDNLLQRKVFAFLSEKAGPPSEDDIRAYYEKNKNQFIQKAQVRLRQIVFENEDAAQQLYHSLKPSSSFSELAKKFSVAPEAKKGGDTGWIEKGSLEIFDAAFGMKLGQRSGVLKSPYGYHIFEVTDKKPEVSLKYSDSRDKILKILKSKNEQSIYIEWLEGQVRQTKVYKNDEALKLIQVKAIGE